MASPPTTGPLAKRDTVTLLEAVARAQEGSGAPDFWYDESGQLIAPLAVKAWCIKRGKVDSSLDKPRWFRHHTLEIDSLEAWYDALRIIQHRPHMMRVSGMLKPDATLRSTRHGDLVTRAYTQEDDPFVGQPLGTHLLAIDIDNLEPPDWADYETREGRADLMRWAIKAALPPAFHDAAAVGQWSSSAGMRCDDEGRWTKIKLHLWFWSDRPIHCLSLREWARGHEYVDGMLYNSVQPHHVAAPAFRDGLTDPLPEWRVDFLHGEPLIAPADLVDRPTYDTQKAEADAKTAKENEAKRKRALRRRRGLRPLGDIEERRARALLLARCEMLDEIYHEQGGAHPACLRLAMWCFQLRDHLSEAEIESALMDVCVPLLESAGTRTGESSRNRSATKARRELNGYPTAIIPTAKRVSEAKPLPPERIQTPVARLLSAAPKPGLVSPENESPIDTCCKDVLTNDAPPVPKRTDQRRVLTLNQPYFTAMEGAPWKDGWEDVYKWHYQEATPRVLALNGEKKTGKTLLLEKASASTKAQFLRSASIVGRRTLAYNTAPRLGLENYLELRAGEITARNVVVCLNSIHRIAVTDDNNETVSFGLVILDEVEQLSRHLFNHTIGKHSGPIFDRLSTILQRAERIIIADADLAHTGWALVRAALGRDPDAYFDDELEVVNTYIDPSRVDAYYDTKDQACHAILEAIRRGEKVAVPCAFKRQGHALATVAKHYIDGERQRIGDDHVAVDNLIANAKTIRPGLRYLVVSSRTTGDKKVQAFLADPNAWLAANPLDLLVYSPTLGTGVSIDVPFDRLIGLFHAGLHTVHDVMQMMGRVRSCTRWEMWIEPKEMQLTTDRDELERMYLTDIRRAFWLGQRFGLREVLDANGNIKLKITNPRHWDLFITVRAAEHAHKAQLLRSCVAYSQSRGITVEHCADTLDPFTRQDVQMAMGIGGIAADEDEVAAVFGAVKISWGEARAIMQRGARTRDEELRVHRAQIRRHLGREITETDVRLDVTERFVARTRRLAKVGHIFDKATTDAAQIQAWLDDVLCQPDWDTGGDDLTIDLFAAHTPDVVRARALAKVLWLAGIHLEHLSGETPYEMDHATLLARRWPQKIKRYAETLELARWGLAIPKDMPESPMRYLKQVCAAVGIRLELLCQPRVSGGRRSRVYSFDLEQRELAWSWSEAERKRLAGMVVEDPDQNPQSPWPEVAQEVAQTGANTRIDRGSVPPASQEEEPTSAALQGTLPLSPTSPTGANVTRTGHPPIGPP